MPEEFTTDDDEDEEDDDSNGTICDALVVLHAID